MSLTSWIVEIQKRFKRETTDSIAIEYQQWRDRFLLERLYLVKWIAIIALPTFLLLDLIVASTHNGTGQLDRHVSQEEIFLWVLQYCAIELSLLLGLLLLRIPALRRYPAILFLHFSWSLNLLPQVQATLTGEADLSQLSWLLVFLTQATLVPVCWQLHLISQVVVLGYYLCMSCIFGLQDPTISRDSLYLTQVVTLFVQFWFCFICNFGVYLYERLQKREFAYRQQVRVFLHAVSHDLRNPVLGTLMVLKNLLNQPGDSILMSRSLLERLVNGTSRQLELINSLIEAHSTEVRGLVAHCQPIQLGDLVKSVLADLQPMFVQEQTQLVNLIPDTLPLINADPLQLSRVYQNLIANALKHNPPGLTLTLNATHEGDWIRCTVGDNGVGMHPEQSAQLFELYFRGTQRRQSVGLGLGLYLCRQIVTAHGGEIGIESYPAQGAKFWFTLPVAVSPKTGSTFYQGYLNLPEDGLN